MPKHDKKKPKIVSVTRDGKHRWKDKNMMHVSQLKLSQHADTNLPDVMYIRDIEHQAQLGIDQWNAHRDPDAFAVTNQQVEVGVYELRKIIRVSSIIKISEDIIED